MKMKPHPSNLPVRDLLRLPPAHLPAEGHHRRRGRQSTRRRAGWPLVSSRPGRIILQLDDGAGRLSERVELRTFGRRIPFGLSGPGSQEHSESWFHWAHGRFRQDFRISSALQAIFL